MSAPGDRPNVVLVNCHDVGQYLGCYGEDVATPHLDGLAAEGVRLENFFATAPQCSPSRASIHTGRYPHATGVLGLTHRNWDMDHGLTTLGDALADAGYTTRLYGDQHAASDAGTLGFERDHTDLPGEDASDQLWETLDELEADRPFFASVALGYPHRELGHPDYDGPDPGSVTVPPYLPDVPAVREDVAALHESVMATDDAVGNVLAALRERDLLEESVVLFVADHGIAFPRAKGMCYDPGVETALLMRHPSFERTVREELLSNVDLLPTLLDLAGVDVPDGVHGRSFRPLLIGGEYEEREHVFLEITWHDRYNPIRAVRTREYKYCYNFWQQERVYLPSDVFDSPSGREVRGEYYTATRDCEELYDLCEDPGERTNVAGEATRDDVRTELRERLFDWMEATDDPLLDGPVAPPHLRPPFR